MILRDWRQALKSPPTYKLGNRTFRFHFCIILLIILVVLFVLIYGLCSTSLYNQNKIQNIDNFYNYTYPLTKPFMANGGYTFKIGLIADLDTNSKSKSENNVWKSYLKLGYLNYNLNDKKTIITWDKNEPNELKSGYSLKGRGMELSELIVFNGKLLTFDDRTGIVYELLNNNKLIPWVILNDGDGKISKGFKSEWATVKDKHLYVGSMGKEWTSSYGEFENDYPMYVKIISTRGEIKHVSWKNQYKALREVIGIRWPGYMIHESAMWSAKHKQWFFLPRRCSKERYNETRDEYMGCNVLITSDEYFSNINVIKVGDLVGAQGYSSFKFVPGTDDTIIVALSTEEVNGKTSTYISAFNIDGETILKKERVPTNFKYEGIEFI